MDIVVILLLSINVVLCLNSIINLDEIEEAIGGYKVMINVVNSLNRRISKIEEKEKERDETNTKGREQKE